MKLNQEYTDDERQALLNQVRYHLGRVLFLGDLDYNEAVANLDKAVSADPNNISAYYYLGQAIRAQVERNILERAADVLRTYLEGGAPLGDEDKVREFIGSRKSRQR